MCLFTCFSKLLNSRGTHRVFDHMSGHCSTLLLCACAHIAYKIRESRPKIISSPKTPPFAPPPTPPFPPQCQVGPQALAAYRWPCSRTASATEAATTGNSPATQPTGTADTNQSAAHIHANVPSRTSETTDLTPNPVPKIWCE